MSFDPIERRQAIWASDARKIGSGRALDVYLEKIGEQDPPDLSDVEAVQMGHVMQPIIGRLTEDRLKMRLKDMGDIAVVHPTERWMRSHYDFIDDTGKVLVEAKNYNAMARNKFGENLGDYVPPADYYQCLHEATVMGVERVILAVLFGGQEFCTFDLRFSEDQKQELIELEANLWGRINARTPPPPETADEARKLYPMSMSDAVTATADLEQLISGLANIRNTRKRLEAEEDKMQGEICGFMKTAENLVSIDGRVLATWKTSKPSKRFSSDMFKSSMPDIYEQFVIEQPGSRRFLVKGA